MACGVEEVPQVSFVSDLGRGVTGSGEAAGREGGVKAFSSLLGVETVFL